MHSPRGIEQFPWAEKEKAEGREALRFVSRGIPGKRLTLGELEALAGAGLAGLLALFLAGVTGEVTGLLEGNAELGIELQQGAGDAVGNRTGLAADAAAGDVHGHIELVLAVGSDERREGALHEVVVGEIGLELAFVDDGLAGAGNDADAGGGRLATAGAEIDGGFSAHGLT